VRDIDATTRAALQEVLSEAFADGAGLDRLITEVDGVMGDRLERASRIARTETSAAYNFGTLEGYRQSGVVSQKEWLTSHDEAVRETHKAIEEAGPIPLDADFISPDGARLSFPGDPDCNRCGRGSKLPLHDGSGPLTSGPRHPRSHK
jgi:SPP1 gp7 family putative phage head morphogenesis protein